jgi:hypothetical protein
MPLTRPLAALALAGGLVLSPPVPPGAPAAGVSRNVNGGPPLGAWKQSGTDKVNLIRFEPRRMVQFAQGRLRFERVRYEDGRILRVDLDGTRQPLDRFEVKGDTLTVITAAGKRVAFERLAKDPPELLLKSLPLAPRKPVPPERAEAVRRELARREQVSVRVRLEYREALKDDASRKAKLAEMMKIDAADSRYLAGLLREVGWVDSERFGGAAEHGAYLIVMHTHDLALMQTGIEELEKEVKAKRFDAEQFAGLFDRFRGIVALPQRYGMVVTHTARGEMVLGPLEDRKRVDEFRKAIGLPPLARYLERYRQDNGGKDVRVVDD